MSGRGGGGRGGGDGGGDGGGQSEGGQGGRRIGDEGREGKGTSFFGVALGKGEEEGESSPLDASYVPSLFSPAGWERGYDS